MARTFEITSLSSLRTWLKEHAASAEQWYAAPHPGYSKRLIVSAQPWYDYSWDSQTIERRVLDAIVVPELTDARQWWFDIWESQISLFWYAPHPRVLLMAKIAAWKAIPERYLLRPKAEFFEISETLFRETIGQAAFIKMVGECNFCGLATRTLDAAAAAKLQEQLP